jgi:hypothetical protein
MQKLIIKNDMSTWHTKIRVIQVRQGSIRITQNKFGFYKLPPKIPEQKPGYEYFEFQYSGFGLRIFAQP